MTARWAVLFESDAVGTTPEKIDWPRINVAKHATSLIMNIDTRRTVSFPSTSSTRWGTAASVVRMEPEEYSLVMKSAPMTPIANWAKIPPTRLVDTGSNVSLLDSLAVAQWARNSDVTNAPSP